MCEGIRLLLCTQTYLVKHTLCNHNAKCCAAPLQNHPKRIDSRHTESGLNQTPQLLQSIISVGSYNLKIISNWWNLDTHIASHNHSGTLNPSTQYNEFRLTLSTQYTKFRLTLSTLHLLNSNNDLNQVTTTRMGMTWSLQYE